MLVKGLSQPAEEGSVVSDSDESISSADKARKRNSSKSNSSNSKSVDSYHSNEFYRLTNMNYTQRDGTQLDPYHQGPLEQEHEILFQSDSEESENRPRTTQSGTQYTLLGIELAALNVEENYTNGTKQWSKRNSSSSA